MINERELLERAARRFEPEAGLTDRVYRRRERKDHNRRIRAGAVGVIVALAFVAIGFRLLESERGPVTGPATSPSPMAPPSPVTQPPSPFTERFDSPLHGLSIGYPVGWRTRAATEPWGHSALAFGAPDVDVIFDPTLREDLYLAVVSEPLGGRSAQDWAFDMAMNLESVGICTRAVGSGGGGGDPFDGNYAWFESCDTPVGSDDVVVTGTATRGYIINLHVGDGHAERLFQATYDGDFFEAALKTVDLRPEDALDTLSPSESP